MFKYVGDISELSHNIITQYVENKSVAIDCTLGNGYDCDFLSNNFSKVYAFDIQNLAIDTYKQREKHNVILINDSHEFINKYVHEKIDVAVYNLGFLPGGDKTITTKAKSTLKSIEISLEYLKSGGFVFIAVYIGHEEGAIEGEAILNYVSSLSKKLYGVMIHKFINRSPLSPYLIVIEKK